VLSTTMTAMPKASSPIHAFEGFASPGAPAGGTVTSVASQALRVPVRGFTDSGSYGARFPRTHASATRRASPTITANWVCWATPDGLTSAT
jgi:hypothetical protein